jgi:hypothetical protein
MDKLPQCYVCICLTPLEQHEVYTCVRTDHFFTCRVLSAVQASQRRCSMTTEHNPDFRDQGRPLHAPHNAYPQDVSFVGHTRFAHLRSHTCESSSKTISSLVFGLTFRIRSTGVTNCVTSNAAWPVGSVIGNCSSLALEAWSMTKCAENQGNRSSSPLDEHSDDK